MNESDLIARAAGGDTAAFGVLVPGTYYTEYADEQYSGFDDNVYAGQIIGQVRF